ncbi:MAG: hypothetical protein HQK54_16950 [Oligoflexales bacterium]|nr:hypothetical protein [Oligoflexales bacterium]
MKTILILAVAFCFFSCFRKSKPVDAEDNLSVRKQSNAAKNTLQTLFTLQESHFADKGEYSADLKEIGFEKLAGDTNDYKCDVEEKSKFLCVANIHSAGHSISISINEMKQIKHESN